MEEDLIKEVRVIHSDNWKACFCLNYRTYKLRRCCSKTEFTSNKLFWISFFSAIGGRILVSFAEVLFKSVF